MSNTVELVLTVFHSRTCFALVELVETFKHRRSNSRSNIVGLVLLHLSRPKKDYFGSSLSI